MYEFICTDDDFNWDSTMLGKKISRMERKFKEDKKLALLKKITRSVQFK